MITTFIEIIELPRFSHIYNTTWVTWNFAGDAMDKNYDIIKFILKYSDEKRPRVANFANIIKIEITFFKATDSNKNQKNHYVCI